MESEWQFEWDYLKEVENFKKHRVLFSDAVESFRDPAGILLDDLKHSTKEQRFYWIGMTRSRRILTTWFTQRGSSIRIIGSAEFRKFRRIYYEATQTC